MTRASARPRVSALWYGDVPNPCPVRYRVSGELSPASCDRHAEARARTSPRARTFCARSRVRQILPSRDHLPAWRCRASSRGSSRRHLRRRGATARQVEKTLGRRAATRTVAVARRGSPKNSSRRTPQESRLAIVSRAAVLRPLVTALWFSHPTLWSMDAVTRSLAFHQRPFAPRAPRSHPHREVRIL